MNLLGLIFTLFLAIALLLSPRTYATAPLLLGTFYLTLAQGFELGPFTFTSLRILILAGLIRVLIRRELPQKLKRIDITLLAFGFWAIASSIFHNSPSDALVYRLGVAYNALGVYFIIRSLCPELKHASSYIAILSIILIPIAGAMAIEKLSGRNLFSVFGGVPEQATVRDGKVRATAAFQHPILAGTAGAVSIPLVIGILSRPNKYIRAGLLSTTVIVFTSASSGPLISAATGLLATMLWPWRHLTKRLQFLLVLAYIALDIAMKAPAYYLIARVDLTGSSTGYHRAALIQSAIEHIDEWWLYGTDYTRHWMATGVSWSPDHTDITNQYLSYGVLGGLPLLLLFIFALFLAFRNIGAILTAVETNDKRNAFTVWCIGASLFAHVATFLSVSYFDQTFFLLYATLALTSATGSTQAEAD